MPRTEPLYRHKLVVLLSLRMCAPSKQVALGSRGRWSLDLREINKGVFLDISRMCDHVLTILVFLTFILKVKNW